MYLTYVTFPVYTRALVRYSTYSMYIGDSAASCVCVRARSHGRQGKMYSSTVLRRLDLLIFLSFSNHDPLPKPDTFSLGFAAESHQGERSMTVGADPNFQQSSLTPAPSWIRGRGNHCETCQFWSQDRDWKYVGLCYSPTSVDSGERTDCRYRCPSFIRKEGT